MPSAPESRCRRGLPERMSALLRGAGLRRALGGADGVSLHVRTPGPGEAQKQIREFSFHQNAFSWVCTCTF